MRPADGTPVGLRNRASLGAGVRAFNRVNARHPWSHNEHLHGWVLRQLPTRRRTAIDVGCGRGLLLEQLAGRFEHAVGIDPDAEMVAATRARGLEVRQESLMDATGRYDAVTAIAALHHLPFETALTRARELVAPGGRLLVVGLAQLGSPVDVAYDSASLLLNPLVGLVKHPRVSHEPGPSVPVRDPEETYGEVRAVAERVLPGVAFRHRLWFRYTLLWER